MDEKFEKFGRCMAELKQENIGLRHEVEELRRVNAGLQHDVEELKGENVELRRENAELRRENAGQKHDIKELRGQLEDTTKAVLGVRLLLLLLFSHSCMGVIG
jgi:FtsZ-binding cell division protein ZapB